MPTLQQLLERIEINELRTQRLERELTRLKAEKPKATPAKKKATAKPITRAEIQRRIDIKTERFRANYKSKAA